MLFFFLYYKSLIKLCYTFYYSVNKIYKYFICVMEVIKVLINKKKTIIV